MLPEGLILVIDQGTHAMRALAFEQEGRVQTLLSIGRNQANSGAIASLAGTDLNSAKI